MRTLILLSIPLLPSVAWAQPNYATFQADQTPARMAVYVTEIPNWEVTKTTTGTLITLTNASAFDSIEIPARMIESYNIQINTELKNARRNTLVTCDCDAKIHAGNTHFIEVAFYPVLLEVPILAEPEIGDTDLDTTWWYGNKTNKEGQASRSLAQLPFVNEVGDNERLVSSSNLKSDQRRRIAALNVDSYKADRNQIDIEIGVLPNAGASKTQDQINGNCELEHLYKQEDVGESSVYLDLILDRTAVTNDAENQSEAVRLKLAKTMMGLGLINEAQGNLDLLEQSNNNVSILLKINAILNGLRNIHFTEQEEEICRGALDVWNLISDMNTQNRPLNYSASLLQFKSLRPQVQRIIHDRFRKAIESVPVIEEFDDYSRVMNIGPLYHPMQKGDMDISAILRQANRDIPSMTPKILSDATNLSFNERQEIAQSIRTENRETGIWIDLIIAEIEFHISRGEFGIAIQKIDEMHLETGNSIQKERLLRLVGTGVLGTSTRSDILSIYTSLEFKNWPADIRSEIRKRVINFGVDLQEEKNDDSRLSSLRTDGYFTGFDSNRQATIVKNISFDRELIKQALDEAQSMRLTLENSERDIEFSQ